MWQCFGVLPAQDHLLPEEYVHTMRRHTLDHCPVSPYAEDRRNKVPPCNCFGVLPGTGPPAAGGVRAHHAAPHAGPLPGVALRGGP